MSFDLRSDPWIPFRHLDGRIHWGSIADVADPGIEALSTGRPDFDGAIMEFLVGTVSLAMGARSEEEWRSFWKTPPTREQLAQRLADLPPAFDLDADGPRFMQDSSPADLAECELQPPQELLVDAKNSTLFIKPDRIARMSRPAAAMALITIQAYSPAGGRGYRTSLRGGGPLTTLIEPRFNGTSAADSREPLWKLIWANAEVREHWPRWPDDSSAVFPWMGPTRTSEPKAGISTAPTDVSELQYYFGMPRRIRLEFGSAPARCDLTGREDECPVTGFRVKSYGVHYQAWRHPLSPYYRGKGKDEWLPVHGRAGGLGWRDWLGLLYKDSSDNHAPARAVATFIARRAERINRRSFRVWAFGYDVDNAKARVWVEGLLPGFAEADPDRLESIRALVEAIVDGTDTAAFMLYHAVRRALFDSPDEARGDLSQVKSELWSATEQPFYDGVTRALRDGDSRNGTMQEFRERFLGIVTTCALEIFDRYAPLESTEPEILRRTIVARFGLVTTLRGGGKKGAEIFKAFGLATPKEKRTRARSVARTSQEMP